jgi:hypothetical protein
MTITVLLIIVGAGATFDSDWRRPADRGPLPHTLAWDQLGLAFRPPLAKDLFDEDRFGEYVASYPPSQGLMDQLRRAAPAVEQELERIRDLSKDQEHLPRQLLAVRYYLRDVIAQTVGRWNKAKPDHMTNFTRLMARLEPWRQQRARAQGAPERVAIVTFNYDTLFDNSLRNLLPGFPLAAIADYTSDARYALFKLHGSVDWWREVHGEWIASVGQASPPTYWSTMMFDPPGSYAEAGAFFVGHTSRPCVPCLALPTATKGVADFACPDAQVSDLLQLLPEVTDVLIIGWKGIEGHFLEEWRKVHAGKPDRKIRSLAVVDASLDAAMEVQARVTGAVGITAQERPLFETFSGFVIDKLDDYLQDTLRARAAGSGAKG